MFCLSQKNKEISIICKDLYKLKLNHWIPSKKNAKFTKRDSKTLSWISYDDENGTIFILCILLIIIYIISIINRYCEI